MFPLCNKISKLCAQYGVSIRAETAAEAHVSADNHDTDWEGYNNAGCYEDVSDSDEPNLAKQKHDPDNGHLPEKAAAGGLSGSSKQKAGRRRGGRGSGRGALAVNTNLSQSLAAQVVLIEEVAWNKTMCRGFLDSLRL